MNNTKIFFYFEKILFSPTRFDFIPIILLSPFSVIYCIVTFFNALRKHIFQKKFSAKIIGIGNLVLGGTGKTPLTIALAKNETNIAIILRGYGRDSKGLVLVSKNGNILVNISESGDEAFLYAEQIPKSTIIVSENREIGILKAQELGHSLIFLDDSYRQHQIYKDVEYLILDKSQNYFCIPAGAYREKLWFFKKNIKIVRENIDFWREVKIENPTEKMVLITAISKPHRLNKYISENIPKYIFPDHYKFQRDEIEKILKNENATSILTTEKDFVKLKSFKFNISLIKLDIKLKKGF